MLTFIEHEDYYKHKMPQILESPKRLRVIMKALTDHKILDKKSVQKVSPECAKEEILKTLHTEQLVDTVKHGSLVGETAITSDTITNEFTFSAALRAVGGAILAAGRAIEKKDSINFALTRPPGHHATRANAMGFCFFNNIALAANYLVDKRKAKKIAIIDIDNHYGNGTADLFYERSDILTISLHADPRISFPFQGRISEIGEGEGEGYNICVPLPPKTGDRDYLQVFERIVPPIVEDFKPEIIFVSAGYDGLDEDPYGYLGLSPFGFQAITEKIMLLAKDVCSSKIALTLEGGYKFEELGEAFVNSILPFIQDYQFNDKKLFAKLNTSGNKNQIKENLAELKRTLKPYWKLD